MKSAAVIKHHTFRAFAALMLAVSALSLVPVADAAARDARIKIFQLGKTVLICHYDEHGNWLYCDVASK